MMLGDEIRRGVERAQVAAGLYDEDVEQVAAAIASAAVVDAQGRHALTLDSSADSLVYYDLIKAVTAAAGALGATLAAVSAPIALPAVLSAVSALAGLHGLRRPLPRSCAEIVAVLLENPQREMTRGELLKAFVEVYDGPPTEMEAELDRALAGLERVKSVQIERGSVRLVERIVIRLR